MLFWVYYTSNPLANPTLNACGKHIRVVDCCGITEAPKQLLPQSEYHRIARAQIHSLVTIGEETAQLFIFFILVCVLMLKSLL